MDADPLSQRDDHNFKQKQQQSDFATELKQAQDPDILLVRWCLEGRPRVTAALAEEGSVVRLAAQLLSETTHKSYGAASAPTVEIAILKAAFMHKLGYSMDSLVEFRKIALNPDISSHWRRRAYVAIGWILLSLGDFRGCTRNSIDEGLKESLSDEDKYALLIASSRLKAELGDSVGARRDLETAKVKYPHLTTSRFDARLTLAEARVCFSEGDLHNAAKCWNDQTMIQSSTISFPSIPQESVASYLAAFAVAAVVGDLGDFIIEGSRAARHEAANNFSVCALHAGRLDGAVAALEEVMKSFGAPGVFDSVAAGNLKTLYELCRTPEHARIV